MSLFIKKKKRLATQRLYINQMGREQGELGEKRTWDVK